MRMSRARLSLYVRGHISNGPRRTPQPRARGELPAPHGPRLDSALALCVEISNIFYHSRHFINKFIYEILDTLFFHTQTISILFGYSVCIIIGKISRNNFMHTWTSPRRRREKKGRERGREGERERGRGGRERGRGRKGRQSVILCTKTRTRERLSDSPIFIRRGSNSLFE